jgi:hypothetical protein
MICRISIIFENVRFFMILLQSKFAQGSDVSAADEYSCAISFLQIIRPRFSVPSDMQKAAIILNLSIFSRFEIAVSDVQSAPITFFSFHCLFPQM